MKKDLALVALAVLALGGAVACSRDPEAGTALEAVPAVDPAFRGRLEAAATGHGSMGRVDDLGRWAPTLCMAPSPPSARFSASADAATHGGKLYAMYAKDRRAYVGLSDPEEARRRMTLPTEVLGLEDCTQVVVKEAFAPVEWTGAKDKDGPTKGLPSRSAHDEHGLRPATKDGKAYASGERKGLFVMFRVDPKTANTDDGWVYGTVAPDGTVTGCGKMESCMACHLKAPHGRLFGLPVDAR